MCEVIRIYEGINYSFFLRNLKVKGEMERILSIKREISILVY